MSVTFAGSCGVEGKAGDAVASGTVNVSCRATGESGGAVACPLESLTLSSVTGDAIDDLLSVSTALLCF